MLRVACLALATLCLLTRAEDELPAVGEVQRKCLEQFKLDEDAIAMLNNTTYLETKDPTIQCFVKCFLMGFKLMNDAGDITLDHLKLRNNTKTLEVVDKCGGISGTDPCDKAVNLQNCLLKIITPEEELSTEGTIPRERTGEAHS